jgi:hypothetical protein
VPAASRREERQAIVQLRDAAKDLLKKLGEFDWAYQSNLHDPGRLDLQLAIDNLQEKLQ